MRGDAAACGLTYRYSPDAIPRTNYKPAEGVKGKNQPLSPIKRDDFILRTLLADVN